MRILAFKVFVRNPSYYKARVIKDVLDNKNCQLQSMLKYNKLVYNLNKLYKIIFLMVKLKILIKISKITKKLFIFMNN